MKENTDKKTERYFSLMNALENMNQIIVEEGETLISKDGSQTPHPLLNERAKVTREMEMIKALLYLDESRKIRNKKGFFF